MEVVEVGEGCPSGLGTGSMLHLFALFFNSGFQQSVHSLPNVPFWSFIQSFPLCTPGLWKISDPLDNVFGRRCGESRCLGGVSSSRRNSFLCTFSSLDSEMFFFCCQRSFVTTIHCYHDIYESRWLLRATYRRFSFSSP